jgi:aspartyl-tRNA(Asn)/glutamyl-tRNA(Gln) amidotransferase subunit C
MLTDAECRNATCPPEKTRARLADAAGLYLEVSPNGSKRWFWKYRTEGKEKRLALGSYPSTGPKDARAARDAAKAQKTGGNDPIKARKVAKLARIRVDEADLSALAGELSGIVTFMEQLNEVDVTAIDPMVSVTPMRLKRRADVVTDGDIQRQILANAPDAREGFFAVPKVVE